MYRLFLMSLLVVFTTFTAHAQSSSPLQDIIQQDPKPIERASRKTIEPVLDRLISSNLENVAEFLENWRTKNVWMRKDDKQFFYGQKNGKLYDLIDIDTGDIVGQFEKKQIKQLKPNSGVRAVIAATLVQFQLSAPEINRRLEALNAIERDPEASHLTALRASIDNEENETLRARKYHLETLLTIRFEEDELARINAISSLKGNIGLDVRAVLSTILATERFVTNTKPEDQNIARILTPERDLSKEDAIALLVKAKLVDPIATTDERKKILIDNIVDGRVGEISVHQLDTQQRRDEAYAQLVKKGIAPPAPDAAILSNFTFYDAYLEPSKALTDAAAEVMRGIENQVSLFGILDLSLDGLSLASIYFLAAIGLAITFGVMGVINMAHGEFIMMGAYTGYVVQQFIADYTISILVALPLAFGITFAAGVAMERLVIRHLMHRPLETLLATFGISIALQQIAKNIFGTQARPLTSPGWLDGAWVLNDVVSISYIRVAIFVLALIFLVLLLFILNRTRLGLEVRAVTQNPRMASSMGINPDKINMLTFGLGSGIAGIAGVAIGLFAKVTSELGSGYIVQSFMTVVVGGVGNIWGTLAGAGMIGSLQKIIEWFNPSNTLAAQTYMIIFIIIFIQFRPKGIFALKGRAAGD